MKKSILFLFLAISLTCFAQKGSVPTDIDAVKFYGIDYSMAKVYGAAESPAQFKIAFSAINLLFVTEPKKYDLEKYLGVRVNEISLDAVNEVNNKINPNELITTNKNYTLNDSEVAQAVKALPINTQDPGVGMVFVATLLNKADNYGYYQMVFFDTVSKEILAVTSISGKAGGFGLRNYWAGSIYKALKAMR